MKLDQNERNICGIKDNNNIRGILLITKEKLATTKRKERKKKTNTWILDFGNNSAGRTKNTNIPNRGRINEWSRRD